MYTSRSAIETYQSCPRRRFLQYHYLGYGIDYVEASIPLATGTAVHRGIQEILQSAIETEVNENLEYKLKQVYVDKAVEIAIDAYLKEVQQFGLQGKGTDSEENLAFTIKEQSWLIEGLIRVWAKREFPSLVKNFKFWSVEKEIVISLSPGVEFQSRADAILQDRENGDLFVYSLKTIKDFNWQVAKTYVNDLQGLTETWALETYLNEQNKGLQSVQEGLTAIATDATLPQIEKIKMWVEKQKMPTKVMGVKFCFLLKGKREEQKLSGVGTGKWYTNSPLIRAYRKLESTGVKYAHSWFYPNPNNASGKGALGKGWETFNIWEDMEMSLVQWLVLLEEGNIQPECGDILGGQVFTPMEYFRKDVEIQSAIREITEQEKQISNKLEFIQIQLKQPGLTSVSFREFLDIEFPKYRKSCIYPSECMYQLICFGKEPYTGKNTNSVDVMIDPLGSGRFKLRVPHHVAEASVHKAQLELETQGQHNLFDKDTKILRNQERKEK